MNLQEALQRVDLTDPLIYSQQFTISAKSGEDTETLVILNSDFAVAKINVSAYDTAGDVIDKATAGVDNFKVEMKDNEGHHYQNDPVDLFSIAGHLENFPIKHVLAAKTELTITVSEDTFPAGTICSYPVRVIIDFIGYRLKN